MIRLSLFLVLALSLSACSDQASSSLGSGGNQGSGDGSSSSAGKNNSQSSANSSQSSATSQASADMQQSSSDMEETGEDEWADVVRLTPIARGRGDHANFDENLCNITRSANSVAVVKIESYIGYMAECSSEPYNNYSLGYGRYAVKRVLHLSGLRAPSEFNVNTWDGIDLMEIGKYYLMGVRFIDDDVFTQGGFIEVVPYNADSESPDIKYSGKVASLEKTTEAYLKDLTAYCSPQNNFKTDEEYRGHFLKREKSLCD